MGMRAMLQVAWCTERAARECEERGIPLEQRKNCFVVADSEASAADTDMLCGSTSYLSMLHDEERNSAYQRGLKAALQCCEPGALVLDVGAGLGLLSILACKYAVGRMPRVAGRLPRAVLGPQSGRWLRSRWLRNLDACC
jgi:hypothetical protein